MSKRIEQSRKHGPHDPRRTNRLRLLKDDAAPYEDAELDSAPPILTLVGGTDITPEPTVSRAVLHA